MGRNTIIILLLVFFVLSGLFFLMHASFRGDFDKKFTREELLENFVKHEKQFAYIINHFNPKSPEGHLVRFGVSSFNKVSLVVSPPVVTQDTRIIGGYDLELSSPKLDSVIKVLDLTKETIKNLQNQLLATNCKWIRTTEIQGNPVEMYPDQSGWGSFSYFIFNKPLSDSLIQIHGRPISNSEFGRRVILRYSSAL